MQHFHSTLGSHPFLPFRGYCRWGTAEMSMLVSGYYRGPKLERYNFRDKRECWTKEGVKASNDACYGKDYEAVVDTLHNCPEQTEEDLYEGKRCMVTVELVSIFSMLEYL